MADGEDELEIDDAEILQILEETLYKAPGAAAIEPPSSHVAAPASSRPETASILRKVKKPCVSGLSTPGVRDCDRADSSNVPQCSLLRTASGVGTQRKVTVVNRQAAQVSQENRLHSSTQDIESLSDYYEDGPGSADEAEESPAANKLQLIESPVRPNLTAILPYTIPGPGGFVQKALHSGKNGLFRKVSMGRRKEDTAVTQDGDFDEEETRFTEEPWLRAVGALRLHGGESATVSIIRSRDFEGHVSKFVAVIVAVTQDGFGGAFVTLEDPTGKINGTIHKSVFEEPKYADCVKSGAIVLLQNVAIFRPDSRARLISILAANIIQVFKDGGEIGGEVEPSCGAGTKRKEAPTDYCGTVQTYKALAQSPVEVEGGPNSLGLSAMDGVGEGKKRSKSTESQRLANVARAAGWDLEEDVDQLLDCSLEDLYN